jgi:hypothetical protein
MHSGPPFPLFRLRLGGYGLHDPWNIDGAGGVFSAVDRIESSYGGEMYCPSRVPTMFIAMMEHPEFKNFSFPHLRTGIMAGSPCPVKVMQQLLTK